MKQNSSISLATAIKWINAWKHKTDISGQAFVASLIPMEDATGIINEKAVNLRAYNGFDEEKQLFKLILVGVDALGNDIVPDGDPESTDNSEIYDLTLPCPNTCPNESPLFTGIL
jgi:hypothetical protein